MLVTDRAEISTTLPSSDLIKIPTLGQNVTQLELLAPGTVRNTYDIAGAENPQGGQANNANALLFVFTNRQIDGADDMDACWSRIWPAATLVRHQSRNLRSSENDAIQLEV